MKDQLHRLLVLVFATTLMGSVIAPLAGAADSKPKSGATVAPESWVRTVCSSVSSWRDDTGSLQSDFDALVAQVQDESVTPAKGQKKLVQGAQRAVKVTDAMIDEIEKAGVVDIGDGKSIAKKLIKVLAAYRRVYDRARVGFEGAKTNSADGFLSTSEAVMGRAVNDFNDVGDPLAPLAADKDLAPMLVAEPACTDLIQGPDELALSIGSCILDDNVANVVACTEPHFGEVYAMPTVADMIKFQMGMDTGPGAPYPGDGALQAVSDVLCGTNFNDYVGASFDESEFDFGYMIPSEDQWASGFRRTLCVVYRDDGQPFVGSAQGTS